MKLDLLGLNFGYLKVIAPAPSRNSRAFWLCECKCGNKKIVSASDLKSGHTSSCGCKKHESHNATHGMTNTPLHKKWCSMRQRCFDTKSSTYKYYGGKGIKVCQEWNDFMAFYDWAINNGYKEGLSIDRIDPQGDYSPDNCRWISLEEQANNRTTNLFFTYNGKTKTLKQWCREFGKESKYNVIYQRIVRDHYSFEDAMFSERYALRGITSKVV